METGITKVLSSGGREGVEKGQENSLGNSDVPFLDGNVGYKSIRIPQNSPNHTLKPVFLG